MSNPEFDEYRAVAERIYGGMSREELLKWQQVARVRYSVVGPTHDIVACLEVLNEKLRALDTASEVKPRSGAGQ